jgi:2-oxoglutarate ferredoxin oxidoreductase subunit beta
MRPESFADVADRPYRPSRLRTGVLAKHDRPEYGRLCRERAARARPEKRR